jgi:hypothetical protein
LEGYREVRRSGTFHRVLKAEKLRESVFEPGSKNSFNRIARKDQSLFNRQAEPFYLFRFSDLSDQFFYKRYHRLSLRRIRSPKTYHEANGAQNGVEFPFFQGN